MPSRLGACEAAACVTAGHDAKMQTNASAAPSRGMRFWDMSCATFPAEIIGERSVLARRSSTATAAASLSGCCRLPCWLHCMRFGVHQCAARPKHRSSRRRESMSANLAFRGETPADLATQPFSYAQAFCPPCRWAKPGSRTCVAGLPPTTGEYVTPVTEGSDHDEKADRHRRVHRGRHVRDGSRVRHRPPHLPECRPTRCAHAHRTQIGCTAPGLFVGAEQPAAARRDG